MAKMKQGLYKTDMLMMRTSHLNKRATMDK